MYIRDNRHGKYLKVFNLEPHMDEYSGIVWCPQTENGTWVAQDNGYVFTTHNTWPRKNIPLQVKQIIQQPGKFAVMEKLRRELGGVTNADQANIPNYFLSQFAMPTPWQVGGSTMAWNPDLPFQDIQQIADPRELLGMVSPLIKAPLEMAFNKNLFFDRPIQEDPWSKVEAPTYLKPFLNLPGVKQLMGADTMKSWYDPNANVQGIDPRWSYLFQQIPFAQNISKWTSATTPPAKRISDIMTGLGGVKFFPYNPEMEKEKVGWENVHTYQDYLNYLKRQKGVNIPSTSTLENFLRYLYGQPVPSETSLKTKAPDLNYLKYLQKLTGLTGPYNPEDLAAFQKAYEMGDITLPKAYNYYGARMKIPSKLLSYYSAKKRGGHGKVRIPKLL